MYRVLLLCKDNSVLSPMAEGYLNFFTDDTIESCSAGINATEIDPVVIALMREEGIDISDKKTIDLAECKSIDFDYILTFDTESEEESHRLPSRPVKYHFDFGSMIPEEASDQELVEAYKHIRGKIKKSVRSFVKEHFDMQKNRE